MAAELGSDAPDQPLRFAIVGTGRISRAHRAGFVAHPERVQLGAVCDIDRNAAQAFIQPLDYPVAIFPDHRQLLKSDVQIDAAILTLPHDLHFAIARDFVEAGVPILVEKPVTRNLQETRALRDLAARAGVPVVAGQMWRHMPETVWLRRWIAEDPLNFGQLRTFNLTVWQSIEAYIGGPQNTTYWILDGEKAGGGIVISVAIHQLDLVRYLSGSDYIQVTARGRFEPPLFNGAESCAMVLLEMSNGAIGTLHADYKTPRTPYSEAMSLFGEYGTIIQHPALGEYHGRFQYATLKDRQTTQFRQMYEDLEWVPGATVAGLEPDRFTNQLLHFATALRSGSKAENHIDINFNTMACIQAIADSLRSGKTEPVAVL